MWSRGTTRPSETYNNLGRETVIAYLTLPERLGWREKVVELEGPDPTYEDLLNKLPELRSASEEFEKSNVKLVVLVNGQHIQFTGGLKTVLKDGDEISIFPPAAGG